MYVFTIALAIFITFTLAMPAIFSIGSIAMKTMYFYTCSNYYAMYQCDNNSSQFQVDVILYKPYGGESFWVVLYHSQPVGVGRAARARPAIPSRAMAACSRLPMLSRDGVLITVGTLLLVEEADVLLCVALVLLFAEEVVEIVVDVVLVDVDIGVDVVEELAAPDPYSH